MKSIQEVFDDPRMEDVSELVVFRCLRDSEAYERNRRWLKRGWAGWWKVAQAPDGIVNLIDSEDGTQIEVWAAPGANKVQPGDDNRWRLSAQTPFFMLGAVPSAGRSFVGKGLTQDGPTYVSRTNGTVDSDSGFLQTLTVVERRRFKMHLRAERNSAASTKVKEVQGHVCKACETDVVDAFGETGLSCIEAHHLYPLSKLKANEVREYDSIKDFAVLCANCHRMIHRMEDPSDLRAFKSFLKKRGR
jgi:hypothetical protein